MTDTDWKPANPCPQCCEDANDPNQEKCMLYAYDLDCKYLAKYQGEIEGQKRLLEYLIANHVVGENDTIIKQMKSQLEER